MSEKKHYYLAAATVKYRKRHMVESADLNSLLVLDTQNITQQVLGHIQQVTQVRFFQSVEQPSPEIIVDDVYISNVIYLGHMTEQEWMYVPAPPKPENLKAVVENIMKGITPEEPVAAPPAAEAPLPVSEEPTDAPVAPEATYSEQEEQIEAARIAQVSPPPYLDIDTPEIPKE